jgi:hypothetical protein
MPVTELLFSGDTTEQGRVIINNAYNQDCIWTGSTGDFTGITKNIITNNDGNNIISGDSSTNSSVVEYSSILAGVGNVIFGQAPNDTTIKNSSIVGGNTNLITHSSSNVDIENCVLVGGEANAITGTSDISNTVIIGGQGLTGDTSDRVYVENIQSFGGRIRNLNTYVIQNNSWQLLGSFPLTVESISLDDEYCLVVNANIAARPSASYFNLEVSSLYFSDIGRVVDIHVVDILPFVNKNVYLGQGSTIGAVFVNGVNLSTNTLQICTTNHTSVRLVVKEKIGINTYVEMYGTGA